MNIYKVLDTRTYNRPSPQSFSRRLLFVLIVARYCNGCSVPSVSLKHSSAGFSCQARDILGIVAEVHNTCVPEGLGPAQFVWYVAPLFGLILPFGVRHNKYADDTQFYIVIAKNLLTQKVGALAQRINIAYINVAWQCFAKSRVQV
jgi:hypothetical protein